MRQSPHASRGSRDFDYESDHLMPKTNKMKSKEWDETPFDTPLKKEKYETSAPYRALCYGFLA